MFPSPFCSHREGSPPNTLLMKGTRSTSCLPLRSQSQIRTSQSDLPAAKVLLLQSLPPTAPGCSPCSRGHPLVSLSGLRCPPLGFVQASLRNRCHLTALGCVFSTPPPPRGSRRGLKQPQRHQAGEGFRVSTTSCATSDRHPLGLIFLTCPLAIVISVLSYELVSVQGDGIAIVLTRGLGPGRGGLESAEKRQSLCA